MTPGELARLRVAACKVADTLDSTSRLQVWLTPAQCAEVGGCERHGGAARRAAVIAAGEGFSEQHLEHWQSEYEEWPPPTDEERAEAWAWFRRTHSRVVADL